MKNKWVSRAVSHIVWQLKREMIISVLWQGAFSLSTLFFLLICKFLVQKFEIFSKELKSRKSFRKKLQNCKKNVFYVRTLLPNSENSYFCTWLYMLRFLHFAKPFCQYLALKVLLLCARSNINMQSAMEMYFRYHIFMPN